MYYFFQLKSLALTALSTTQWATLQRRALPRRVFVITVASQDMSLSTALAPVVLKPSSVTLAEVLDIFRLIVPAFV